MEGGHWVIGVVDNTLEIIGTNTYNYDRQKANLKNLTDSRLNVILDEQDYAYDWTAQVIKDATIDDLDSDAIILAREGYKQRYPKFAKECDSWSDKLFLDKACLTIDGKITKATLLLVGKDVCEPKGTLSANA
ncbi:MAG: hypothetical protein MSA39_06930 [Prevotella sp.]|nr:hypothetical protein [Prevotella sp.]